MEWLDGVIAYYGEPRVRVDEPVRNRDDEGDYEKRCWVWFPSNKNHHISIKRYRRWDSFDDRTTYSYWVVDIGSHLPDMPSVTWRSRTEPDDELMDSLLAATGFLNTPVKVVAS
jgi:hypothetical protein